ncbi:MAG TPA: NAD(P)-dependent oxidoreductase [Thermoanaerobaculia bacterium]|nr:NAD(P)-dependent oxidoreductase [Thermoanaerobaculia bacterium]
MKIAVTGASGLIGSTLVRRTGAIPLTHRDLDITDAGAVREVLSALRPDLVVNCAVIGVDECERDPALAEAVNVTGPSNLARHSPAIIHFSTNYVLDPVNVYGQTKLAGEEAVTSINDRALVIRTSWVFGRGKESFLSTAAAKLQRGERVSAITDTWASTTWVEDLVTRLMEMFGRTGVHAIVNEGVLSYEDFAMEAARLVGADPALIDRITEAEMRRLAPRPRYTPMTSDPPMRPWQEALGEYVRAPFSPSGDWGRRWPKTG